jgi:hypothetical protein
MAGRSMCFGFSAALSSLICVSGAIAGQQCYCRTATGEHVEVGNVACLKTNSGPQEARCEMVLNNTAWIFTGQPCPLAGRTRRPGARTETALAERVSDR